MGFDLLSDVVSQGETLLNARIIDEGHSLELPLAAFDGAPFLLAIQELEKEWQTILSEFPPLIDTGEQKQWLNQLVRRCEAKVITLQLTQDRLKMIRQRAQKRAPADAAPSPVITHYSSLIDQYNVQLVKAQLLYELALKRRNIL